MIFLRPVASIALRKFASSQALMEVRSTTSVPGKRSVTSGMKGPANESFATVDSTVGKPKRRPIFARICTLCMTDSRSWLSTPWYIAG